MSPGPGDEERRPGKGGEPEAALRDAAQEQSRCADCSAANMAHITTCPIGVGFDDALAGDRDWLASRPAGTQYARRTSWAERQHLSGSFRVHPDRVGVTTRVVGHAGGAVRVRSVDIDGEHLGFVDVDPDAGDALAELERAIGALPRTQAVVTSRGVTSLIYRVRPGRSATA